MLPLIFLVVVRELKIFDFCAHSLLSRFLIEVVFGVA